MLGGDACTASRDHFLHAPGIITHPPCLHIPRSPHRQEARVIKTRGAQHQFYAAPAAQMMMMMAPSQSPKHAVMGAPAVMAMAGPPSPSAPTMA